MPDPSETGLPTVSVPDNMPTAEAVAEEEAWIRRLASEGPDAFGGAGALRRDRGQPPGGGTWVSRGHATRDRIFGDGR